MRHWRWRSKLLFAILVAAACYMVGRIGGTIIAYVVPDWSAFLSFALVDVGCGVVTYLLLFAILVAAFAYWRKWHWCSRLLFALLVAAFAWHVWPTPWRYWMDDTGELREHRILRRVERLTARGWGKLRTPENIEGSRHYRGGAREVGEADP